MKILTVDVGTGTQDIFLYDSRLDLENGIKLVLPSPTMIIHRRLRKATHEKRAVVLTGGIMGGGPGAWAAEAHAKAGLPIFATPQAALSFNDDLAAVEAMGIQFVSEDEAASLPDSVLHLELRDFDFAAIRRVFDAYAVSLSGLSAVAVAVFDHGNAPLDISDRQFRFDYLDERIRSHNHLSAFAHRSENIPPSLTRFQAVAKSAGSLDVPLVMMDSAPAAVLGATFDPQVSSRERVIIANLGNFHSLAFRLGGGGIEGVFEHHTGFLTQAKLESLLLHLADGSLTRADVFDDMGHGALIYSPQSLPLDDLSFNVVVTGPRRNLLRDSRLLPYFAVPFGDMMISGCFGLLAATADLHPGLAGEIYASLSGVSSGTAPWDIVG